MKYTSIQGTGVVAHQTELTVEEKYAVMETVRIAKVVGEFKHDFVRPLLQAVCDTCIGIVDPAYESGLKDALHGIEEIIAAARKDDSKSSNEKDISASGYGLRVTPSFVIEAEKAHDAACNLAETAYRCAADKEDYNTSPEHFLVEFMNDLMKRIKEA